MKKQKRIFVVDGNWYLHRVHFTLKTSRPPQEVLPYNLVALILKDALAVKADYLLIAFDGPTVFRYKVFPMYKAKRHGREEDVVDVEGDEPVNDNPIYDYLPFIYSLFEKLGIIYFQPKNYEADDVLCSVGTFFGSMPNIKVICGTQDKDTYQCLSPRVVLYDSSAKDKDRKPKPRYITVEKAEKAKGVKVSQMIDYQTLIGDKIDSIPPIQGMSPFKVKNLLKKYGSIKEWYAQSKSDRPFLQSQKENLRRNRELVRLKTDVLPPNDLEDWKMPKFRGKDGALSRSFYEYQNFLYPKTKGLF